jgi:hypothetical protein
MMGHKEKCSRQRQSGRLTGNIAAEYSLRCDIFQVGLYYAIYLHFKLVLICDNTPEHRNSDVREASRKPSFLGNGLLNTNAYTRMKEFLRVVFPVLSTSRMEIVTDSNSLNVTQLAVL